MYFKINKGIEIIKKTLCYNKIKKISEARLMKVMTFNIRADNVLDINNRWEKRAHLVYETIKYYDCDIIGLQEVTEKMHRDICNNMKDYTILGLGRTKKFFSEKNSLLIKKKYSVLEHKTFWLSKTPSKSGSTVWFSLFPRICTTAVCQSESGQKIRIYNTHLDCLSAKAREFGLKKIIEVMEKNYEKEQLPCILMGDFNVTPNSKLMKNFKDGTYTSKKLFAVQDVNEALYSKTTMSMFKGREKGVHIDYIFVSEEFEIENAEVIKYNKAGKYPSDHYPIVAKLKI